MTARAGAGRRGAGALDVARRCARVLAAILLVALALRLWNIDHGLPFAYNADEDEHFVPHARRDVRRRRSIPATTRTRRR